VDRRRNQEDAEEEVTCLEKNSVNGKCLMPNARNNREFDIRHQCCPN
jgi:hypothetical protein